MCKEQCIHSGRRCMVRSQAMPHLMARPRSRRFARAFGLSVLLLAAALIAVATILTHTVVVVGNPVASSPASSTYAAHSSLLSGDAPYARRRAAAAAAAAAPLNPTPTHTQTTDEEGSADTPDEEDDADSTTPTESQFDDDSFESSLGDSSRESEFDLSPATPIAPRKQTKRSPTASRGAAARSSSTQRPRAPTAPQGDASSTIRSKKSARGSSGSGAATGGARPKRAAALTRARPSVADAAIATPAVPTAAQLAARKDRGISASKYAQARAMQQKQRAQHAAAVAAAEEAAAAAPTSMPAYPVKSKLKFLQTGAATAAPIPASMPIASSLAEPLPLAPVAPTTSNTDDINEAPFETRRPVIKQLRTPTAGAHQSLRQKTKPRRAKAVSPDASLDSSDDEPSQIDTFAPEASSLSSSSLASATPKLTPSVPVYKTKSSVKVPIANVVPKSAPGAYQSTLATPTKMTVLREKIEAYGASGAAAPRAAPQPPAALQDTIQEPAATTADDQQLDGSEEDQEDEEEVTGEEEEDEEDDENEDATEVDGEFDPAKGSSVIPDEGAQDVAAADAGATIQPDAAAVQPEAPNTVSADQSPVTSTVPTVTEPAAPTSVASPQVPVLSVASTEPSDHQEGHAAPVAAPADSTPAAADRSAVPVVESTDATPVAGDASAAVPPPAAVMPPVETMTPTTGDATSEPIHEAAPTTEAPTSGDNVSPEAVPAAPATTSEADAQADAPPQTESSPDIPSESRENNAEAPISPVSVPAVPASPAQVEEELERQEKEEAAAAVATGTDAPPSPIQSADADATVTVDDWKPVPPRTSGHAGLVIGVAFLTFLGFVGLKLKRCLAAEDDPDTDVEEEALLHGGATNGSGSGGGGVSLGATGGRGGKSLGGLSRGDHFAADEDDPEEPYRTRRDRHAHEEDVYTTSTRGMSLKGSTARPRGGLAGKNKKIGIGARPLEDFN